jgi:hypothetical protein
MYTEEKARQLVENLEAKKKRNGSLRKEDQVKLEVASRVLKQNYFRRICLGFLGCMVFISLSVYIGFTISAHSGQSRTTTPVQTVLKNSTVPKNQVTVSKEQRLDTLIQRVEASVIKFGNVLKRKALFKKLPLRLQYQLDIPRQLLLVNKGNQYRNVLLFKRRYAKHLSIRHANINYFYFGFLEGVNSDLAGGFQPRTRRLHMSSDFNPANILDVLVMFHELLHVSQDTAWRQRLRAKADYMVYQRFYSRNNIILAHETTAYAYEILALDIYLDGYLRKTIKGGGRLDLDSIQERLNAKRNGDKATLGLLISFAQRFLPQLETFLITRKFPMNFVNAVGQGYLRRGTRLHILGRNWRPVPYHIR